MPNLANLQTKCKHCHNSILKTKVELVGTTADRGPREQTLTIRTVLVGAYCVQRPQLLDRGLLLTERLSIPVQVVRNWSIHTNHCWKPGMLGCQVAPGGTRRSTAHFFVQLEGLFHLWDQSVRWVPKTLKQSLMFGRELHL